MLLVSARNAEYIGFMNKKRRINNRTIQERHKKELTVYEFSLLRMHDSGTTHQTACLIEEKPPTLLSSI